MVMVVMPDGVVVWRIVFEGDAMGMGAEATRELLLFECTPPCFWVWRIRNVEVGVGDVSWSKALVYRWSCNASVSAYTNTKST
jgi:hypothetical protein